MIRARFTVSVTLLAAALLAAPIAHAQIDRHPELKSRPLAWTAYDGSYLVDTSSRAEMLDFYWNVFAQPYPATNWTGTTSTPTNPGSISEALRVRSMAQLNAYRALNYSPPASEDVTQLAHEQQGALVLALNPTKPLTHSIDSSWTGYNQEAADAVFSSEIGQYFEDTTPFPLTGAIDGFILDLGTSNAALLGHRSQLLYDGTTLGTMGAAQNATTPRDFYVTWKPQGTAYVAPPEDMIAWPAPGYMPQALFRYGGFRWSFAPADQDKVDTSGATVAATFNGRPLPIKSLSRNTYDWPLTWEFDPADLDLTSATGDVDVTITNVAIGGYSTTTTVNGQTVTTVHPGTQHSYHYTVRIFDEATVLSGSFNPNTALLNISTRGTVGNGASVLIAGLIVTGTNPVRVALRAQGPTLAQYGLNAAQKVHLTLYDASGNVLGENTGWKRHPDWRLMQSLGVAPARDDEAAMVTTLWPGNYTVILSDDSGANGIGLVEAFDIDNLSSSRLLNLSTRGMVGNGAQQMIAGFIIKDQPRTVVIRTQGPGLTKLGVPNAVAGTVLSIADSSSNIIATNSGWRTDPRNARLLTDLASYAPSNDAEAALVLTLPPGSYTALVSPANGTPGLGLVEVFDAN